MAISAPPSAVTALQYEFRESNHKVVHRRPVFTGYIRIGSNGRIVSKQHHRIVFTLPSPR